MDVRHLAGKARIEQTRNLQELSRDGNDFFCRLPVSGSPCFICGQNKSSQYGSLCFPPLGENILPNWEHLVRVIGRERLALLCGDGGDTARWVSSWLAELRDAHWKRPADVIVQFPKARPQRDGSFLFPVPRQERGIQVLVAFSHGLALVLAVTVLKATNGH